MIDLLTRLRAWLLPRARWAWRGYRAQPPRVQVIGGAIALLLLVGLANVDDDAETTVAASGRPTKAKPEDRLPIATTTTTERIRATTTTVTTLAASTTTVTTVAVVTTTTAQPVPVAALPATTLPPATVPPPPPTTTPPPPTTITSPPSDCNPNYTPCVPNDPVDVDCAGGSGNGPSYVVGPVYVTGVDVYDLDGNDNDGIGCE